MFKGLTRDATLVERAQEQIENLIITRALAPGDRLPAERPLGEMLKVSRTVVREAIRSLAAKGLIEVRDGSGMYVKSLNSDIVREPLRLLLRSGSITAEQIMEVREALEVRIAGLAAKAGKPDDLEFLERTIQALSSPKLTAIEFAENDVAFHRRLALAAGNLLFSVLASSMNDLMLEVRLRAFSLDGATAPQRAIMYHSRILDRVKAHDAEGARRAMEEHLTEARDTLHRALDRTRESVPDQPLSERLTSRATPASGE